MIYAWCNVHDAMGFTGGHMERAATTTVLA